MSSDKEAIAKAARDSYNALAAALYVELVGRAFLRVENAATIKPDAGVLASLSYELADAFKKIERVKNAAAGPQNVGYDVKELDLGTLK
jgi:hypothetical protein